MAAGQETALQINYKLSDGTLINIYAKDQAHLESLLTSVSDVSSLILATSSALGINNTPAANIANMQAQLGAVEVSADKQCKHGSMQLKTGTSAKGPWKAWMCPAAKNDSSKCEPIWIRQFMRGPWQFENPSCAEVGGDFWFPDKADTSNEMYLARSICGSCTHKTECLEWAVENEHFGIWGGTNEQMRVRIRKGRSVKSNQGVEWCYNQSYSIA